MSVNLPKFAQLSEIKQKAVKLRAEGTSYEAMSSERDTPARTIEDWFCGPSLLAEELTEYKAYLADKQIESTEGFQKTIAKDAEAVWERLKAIALSDDASMPKHVSLAALDSMLDRMGVARVSKTEGELGVTVSEDDRRKRWEEIRNLQSQIKPVQLKQLAGGKN